MNNNQNLNNNQNVMPDSLNPTNPMMQMNNDPSTNNGQENNNRFLNNNVTNTEINDFSTPANNPQQNIMQQQDIMQQSSQPQQEQDSTINSMNIKDNYNNLEKPGYVNDAQVVENMNNYSQKKTIPITKELKTVIAITVVLLIFIIVMPMLFDLISDLRFN